MAKTPIKTELSVQFKPRDIITPSKDHQGITKTVYSHISSLHGLISDWLKMREKGVRICKGITALKLHECMDNYYPSHLKSLMDSLLEILDSIKDIIEGVRIINNQMQALGKLQTGTEPVISTWSVSLISQNVKDMFEALEREYNLKQIITENIAHCRDEKLIEVYVSAWEFEIYFNVQSYSYLFAEAGLSSLS